MKVGGKFGSGGGGGGSSLTYSEQLTPDGVSTFYGIDHNLDTENIICAVYRVTPEGTFVVPFNDTSKQVTTDRMRFNFDTAPSVNDDLLFVIIGF